MEEKKRIRVKEKPKYLKVNLILFVLALFISIFAFGSCGDNEKNFGFTIAEYEEKLKQIVDKNKGNSFIEMEQKERLEDRFRIKLMDNILYTIYVDKDNVVTSSAAIASLDSFVAYNKESRIAFESLVKSIDSTIGITQMYMLFENLGITWDSKMIDHTDIYTLNGIKYTYQGSTKDNRIVLKAEPE